jgi:osmotically-inducible protein OsmY
MKVNKVKNILIGVVFGMLLSSCAALYGKETAGEYIDDAAITGKVKSAILNDSSLRPFEISVETFRGEVQLRGFVDVKWKSNEAEKKAREVKGVRSVKNNIIVRTVKDRDWNKE